MLTDSQHSSCKIFENCTFFFLEIVKIANIYTINATMKIE